MAQNLAGSESMSFGFQESKAELHQGSWYISGDPYVLSRAFKALPHATRKDGKVVIRATDEAAKELHWFSQRFPMTIYPEVVMRTACARYARDQQAASEILSDGYVPRPVQFAKGLGPRAHQSQAASLAKVTKRLLLADGLGCGKAQPLNAKVLCSDGWRTIGSLIIGDTVVDPEGGYGVVTGIYDRGVMEVFEVRTNDGQSTRCTDDHLWEVITKRDRTMGRRRVLPLKEIRKKLRADCGYRQFRYGLPLAQPLPPVIQKTESSCQFPIDPYVLGCLLGDGGLKKNSLTFTNADSDVLIRFNERLPKPVRLVYSQQYDYRVSVGNLGIADRNPLVVAFRNCGLLDKRSNEKFLPDFVWQGSVEQRKEVLAGLLDTDGTASRQGAVSFCSTSERLVDDTRRLIESLGGFASKTSRITKYTHNGIKKEGKRSWLLTIRVPFNPFTQEKKRLRYKVPYMFRGIVSVESVGFEKVRCIRVTTKNNTYITDGTIVTHNTVSALTLIEDPAFRPAVLVVPPALEMQWRRAIERFLPQLTFHALDSVGVYDFKVMKKCKCGHVMDARLKTKRGKLVCDACQAIVWSEAFAPDVVCCSYSKLAHWTAPISQFAKTVIWEECHALRRFQSNKSAAARDIGKAVPCRIGLSATPLYNYGGEIWNILECIAPGFLGPRDSFRETWCTGSGDSSREPALTDPEAFGAYLRGHGIMLRRTAEEVGIKLGDHQKIVMPISSDITKFNDAVSGRASQLARIILSDARVGLGNAMNQMETLLRQATGLAKAHAVCDFVELLLEQDIPVVLFGHHHAVYNVWTERLKNWKPAMYTGQESKLQKDAAVTRFINGDASVFICALRSGEGLDGLQKRSCTAVFGELDWTDAVHQQCSGRLYRDGQLHPVNSYFLLSEFGTDPYMAEVIGAKAQQLAGMVGDRPKGPVKKIDSGAVIRELALKYLNRR